MTLNLKDIFNADLLNIKTNIFFREILTWMTLNGSILTTMKLSPYHTSGKSSIKNIIQFGDAIINMPMN